MKSKGVIEYNTKWDNMAKKRISKIRCKQIRDCLDGFYSFLIGKSYSSAYVYLSRVHSFVKEREITDVSNITLNDYTKYLASIRSMTSSYQITVYSALKKFSKYLVATEMCSRDYMEYVERPKYIETEETKERRERGYLNKIEIKEVAKVYDKNDFNSIRNMAIIYILLNTGIRRAALFKLDIGDIDLKNKFIVVMEKGSVSRKIYISDTTIEKIEKWLNCRKEVGIKTVGNKALFVSSNGERLSTQSIYNIVKKAGIDVIDHELSPHKLRATFGTQLYEATQNVYFVQHRMGHASPQTTEKYIRGQKEEEARKAADLMGDLLQ